MSSAVPYSGQLARMLAISGKRFWCPQLWRWSFIFVFSRLQYSASLARISIPKAANRKALHNIPIYAASHLHPSPFHPATTWRVVVWCAPGHRDIQSGWVASTAKACTQDRKHDPKDFTDTHNPGCFSDAPMPVPTGTQASVRSYATIQYVFVLRCLHWCTFLRWSYWSAVARFIVQFIRLRELRAGSVLV